jgi:adenylate cyclase
MRVLWPTTWQEGSTRSWINRSGSGQTIRDKNDNDAVTDIEAMEKAGLLDGLDGGARLERAELIAWLLEQGFGVEQIRSELAPVRLPVRRALGDDGSQVSARAVSEAHNIDLELLQRIMRALGLPRAADPDATVYLRADAEAAARQQQFIEIGLDTDRVVLMVRRLSEGLSRAVPAIRYAVMSAVLHPGITELQVAKAHEALARQIAPLLGPLICDILFVQLRRGVEGEDLNASERAAGTALPGARLLAVAFADMVGFTRLGEAVPPEDLVRLVERLGDLAREVVDPPVRLVKTIGDAVMLICPDPVKLLDAMLELSEAADRDKTLPQLRIGIASGWAVSRARDWFGSPVNVASRVTEAALPGSVLVAGSVRDAIGDAGRFEWSYVGAPRLKGVRGRTKLFQARRSPGQGSRS